MTDKDILISDLNDISEILNNNGYGGWCETIRKAVAMLKYQDAVEPTWQQGKAYCGSCGKRIVMKVRPKYCYKCGRRIYLSEDNRAEDQIPH